MTCYFSDLHPSQITAREDFAVNLSSEVITKTKGDLATIKMALEVLGKTSKWRIAARHVFDITDLEEDDFADVERGGQYRPIDSNTFNESFYLQKTQEIVQNLSLTKNQINLLLSSQKHF